MTMTMTMTPNPSAILDSRVGRILVADDEDRNRRLFRDILEAEGHEVTMAVDGADAVEQAFARPPDAVLLDVMMPKMDGFEACRRLRQDARTAHLAILMVTALQGRADRLKGIQAGASDFLTKPVDIEEVRLRVANAVLVKHLYDKVQDDYVRLKELESLRDNLTHMVVHDMRSPLMSVSGSYEIVLMDADRLSAEQKEFVAIGQHACRELIDMVSSLLDISRLEAGQMPFDRTPCDVREIARTAAAAVAVQAREKTLTIHVDGEPAGVVADRDVLHRIVVNLLGNAIKFSPEGGSVGVCIASAGNAVRVTVSDQGCGIPPEDHQRIFEKFGQVASNQPRRKASTGLGLTFCKLAVEAHGGAVGVESAVGEGSTFWFTLPSAGPE